MRTLSMTRREFSRLSAIAIAAAAMAIALKRENSRRVIEILSWLPFRYGFPVLRIVYSHLRGTVRSWCWAKCGILSHPGQTKVLETRKGM